jgi:myo-inositol-1(or 4)-monophosphatase
VSGIDENALLDVAREAAQAAAAVLREHFGQRVSGVHSKSSPTDLVSDVDVSAEKEIRRVLARLRPDDAILGEEGGATAGSDSGRFTWVVDPLDGTINFLYGQPMFAVSVACEDDTGAVVGVVLDPNRDECFAATRSGPATLNGSVITGSGCDSLPTALVATGFSYEAEVRARQAEIVSAVLPRARDIRRAGAAAIDLCWCACGRLDAYYERGVQHWDVAAGMLIAERAGLQTRELAEGPGDPWGVLVAPGAIVRELLGLVVGRARSA